MGYGKRTTSSKMDEYDKKFAEMQKYIPFLEAMIERLQNVKDKSREVQLQKMQSLHGILSNSKRKLKIETLQRCEDVLQKLHNKVEKFQGNTPGLHLPNKKGDGNPAQLPIQSKNTTSELSTVTSTTQNAENTKEKEKLNETPASPSPPVSPESGSEIVPIIIPTERSDFPDEKSDSKPASPDQIDTLPTKAPIIIPTERTGSTPSPNSNNSFPKNAEEMSFSEWDMLEECENTNAKSSSWHMHGKKNDDLSVTTTIPRQVAVVPVPSPDGSRRVPLILDKGRLQGENTDARGCETKMDLSVNISDNRLTSPDPEHLILKHKSSSPRLKEPHTITKAAPKPPAPLLLSPPPVSTAPPLSMEDLAELLDESGDGKSEKKPDKTLEDSLLKKDTSKPETGANLTTKDGKGSKKYLLTQEDLDRESERQWEEVHKHIVKFPSKKSSSNVYTTTVCTKSEMVKPGDGKGVMTQAGSSVHAAPSHKHHSLSPGSEIEPRYADNYERRPRHPRDTSIHESMKDKLSANSYCRLPEDELGIPPHHVSPNKLDERLPLYQRRQSNIGPDMIPHRSETEFRMDGPEYFGRQIPNAGHWPPMHGGVPNSNEFCKNTWPPGGNYNISNPPVQNVPYQHPMGMHQQEMWNVSSPMNPVHTEPHMMNEVPHRSNQFSPNMSSGIMPLMSPNAHPPDISHVPRGDGMHDDGPILKPLMSPTNFPMGPQFHNFQGEPRPYEQSFDRGMEYPHARTSWESPGKGADAPFRGDGDVPCGVVGSVDAAASTSGSYPRSSTPGNWNRDRDSRCNRTRGRDSYYNDRNRNETRSNFNRDVRRPEWPGGGHSEWDARFNRDSRSISERDPRIRMDHNVQATATQNVGQTKDTTNSTTIRDPRLAKDKHSPSVKLKDSAYNDRDPRKRQIPSTSSSEKSQVLSPRKTKDEKSKDKPKSPKVSDGHRKSESESLSKAQQEKIAKDKAQSSLESLYGVIDTKTKSGQGLLQKFKIPKIKRSESQQTSSTNVIEKIEETKEEEDKTDKDDARVEVTSSSDGNIQDEDWGGDSACWLKGENKGDPTSPKCLEATGMDDVKVGEADSAMDITPELSSTIETSNLKDDQVKNTKPKEEVTQEYIETLIKKSLESGEGKKLVEQAKLMQKLTEALEPKKLKRIKKILQSETETSSSEKEDDIELKKLRTRKKIRRIVSDSSDEECLADRLRSRNSTPIPEVKDDLTSSTENPVKSKHNSNESLEKPAKNVTRETNPMQKDSVDLDLPENISNTNSNSNAELKAGAEETKDTAQQNEELNDAENALKPQKVKTKRRNSLEMLQEDIREMFICDDVVTATGYRVCRMQKENQSNATVTTLNQPSSAVTKKDDQISKQDSNKISNTETNKAKPKGKPGRKPRNRAKRVIQSSDSEEDQPLALRAALIQSSLILSNDEDTRDEIHLETRRRGKRGAKKEILKEPRVVVEKTEISKLESSKASFDSSSEEDFSIDVSKLTAAVDDSLLLEKHSDEEVSKTNEDSQARDGLNLSEKSEAREDSSHLLGKGKVVETESFSSGGNAGNTPAPKTISAEPNFNEELLSNILVGLVPTKSDSAKTSTIDKGDEADVDEDTNDQQPGDQGTKKNITKKKKKKWRMGILSKKKKKRAHAPSPKIDSDQIQTCSEIDTSSKLDISSDVQEDENNDKLQKNISNNAVPVDTESTKDSIRDDNAEGGINSTNQVPIKQPVLNEQSSDTSQTQPQFETIPKKEPKEIDVKIESTEVKESKENISRAENVEDKKAQELEAVYGTLREFNINQWTEYVLTGQDRYRCWICFFTGKNIVHHYKVQHPGAEILISRLKIADAKAAIKQAEDEEAQNSLTEPSMEKSCKFTCRICCFSAEGARSHAMEAFYEHYTTHTGEYRFRCNFCPYQSVAKGSMRTHFYKLCRKFTRIFNDSITEDEIPEGFNIYGYLCSLCNYVQLMKGNVEKHISFWHPDIPSVKIIKINLSAEMPKQAVATVVDEIKTESAIVKKDVDISPVESTNDKHMLENEDDTNAEQEDTKVTIEYDNPVKLDSDKTDPDCKEKDIITDSIEVPKKLSQTSEDTLSSKKLSVFVCPPELESKEVEIQLERKKRMEKIIEDIGIKLNQGALKKGFSITDKLTDKMRSDLQSEKTETKDLLAISGTSPKDGSDSLMLQAPVLLPEKVIKEDFVQPNTSTHKEAETKSQSKTEEISASDFLTQNLGKKLDSEPHTNSEMSEDTEKSDAKVRDPLISILNQKKDDESEIDNSDNESARDSALLYDFDSSSEQSESELSPDVNTLLKETSSISATSKDPMLTTIQRLAAQLQAAKPLGDSSTSENTEGALEKNSSDSVSETPIMVSVALNENLSGQRENSKCKRTSAELLSGDENSGKCIRLRRLSGDMLSVSNDQEDSMASRSDGDRTNTPTKVDSIFHSDTDEECSFLKIENVVSLAPPANNSGAESPLISDIRKAVETSPIKLGVSVLKRSNCPLILKRAPVALKSPTIQKNLQTVQQSPKEPVKLIPLKTPSPTISKSSIATRGPCFIPIAPKSRSGETKLVSMDTGTLVMPRSVIKTTVAPVVNTRTMTIAHPSGQPVNYKIVKLLRQPNILKPRETLTQTPAMKMKSPEAYNMMLTPAKLSQFYKCMSRDCHFTTDVLVAFFQHHQQHAAEVDKKKSGGPPHDYQRCAYCYQPQESWNQMKMHLEEKHEHCRYQCGFCFYRSIVLSYARVHQETVHPGSKRVIVCKIIKDPRFLKDELNRYEFIHPYVCQHECKKIFYVPEAFIAHLKSKHVSLAPVYKCHLCSSTFGKIDQLLTHYKIHGYYKYQCLYCLHGADAYEELHSHLSTFHYNKIPQILERSLPARIIRGKDVIQQLIIKQFDEPIGPDKCNESTEPATLSSPVQQNIQVQAAKEPTVLSQKENDAVKKPMHGILWQFGSQNGNTPKNTITSTQLEKAQGTDGRKETISIRDILANEANSQSTLVKATEEVSLNTSPKNVKSFLSGGKIITVNLLNNSGVLRTVNPGTNDVALSSNSKADDSDVEILETIDKCETKPNNDVAVLSTKEKPKSTIFIKSEDTINSSNPETSNHLDTDDDKTLDKPSKQLKPLTLEDIKDTGFTGVKLYRCGYRSCAFGARNVSQLKTHVKQCPKRGQNINCIHCNKRFVKVGCLVEHLKLHGLKRFGCSLCSLRFSVSYQALAHMKTKHKVIGTKLVPADPTNPSANGLFIVQRWNDGGQRKRKRRKLADLEEKDELCDKALDIEKSSFGPDEIEQLPRQAIYSREVQCAVCPYTTKVRTNIVRHLQLHAKDQSVPESGPVNPVPCLDKKERMFDKMVNLASSSHQNGRMGGKQKESNKNDDDESLPKFVPEHKRYVCGVAECNYLTVDEAMLRYHLKALHSEEPYFRCPHCPQPTLGQESLNIAIDKMGIHLKMHDARLYKCSHCNYHHYHRHVVERHLTDKHSEKRPFVKVIREFETSDNAQQSVQEEAEEEIPDPDGNHWKCNICEYKCVYKAEMITHASSDHDEKYQFKCTLCTFKTSGKILFEQHIISKHNNDPNVDFILVYQRIKGVNKRNIENNEQGSQDEPFDTTPIWRRDMPRIRHIRGILLEEESNSAADSSQKGVKRKNDTEIAGGKPAKARPVKSASLDEIKLEKDKEKRSQSCEKMSNDNEHSNESADVHNASGSSTPVTLLKAVKKESIDSPETQDITELKCGRFGPYGSPDGNLYVCTLCNQYKTKYKHDMRDHLYRELNYARWHCKECNHSSVNRNSLMKHCNNCHRNKPPKHEPLSQDKAIEFWVRTVLRIQTSLMKGMPVKQNADGTKNTPMSVTSPNNEDVKPPFQKSLIAGPDVLNIDDTSGPEARDEKKNLVKKEISENQSESKKAPVAANSETAKPLTCKHCKMIFTRWRGFKLHVQLIHLKRLGFLCPYCDRSTNSETRMRQHIKAKHPGREEKIIENPAAGGPELSSEFWEKEYGVVFPMKSKKRKRDVSVEGPSTDKDTGDIKTKQEKCSECSFTAINFAGLKAHMRTHSVKPSLKCSQCTFTSPLRGELWDHWKINHSLLPFKLDTSSNPGTSTSTSNAPKETPPVPDYNADIEEEVIPITPAENDLAYSCFYCNFRNKSKDVIKAHWAMLHKNTMPNESLTTSVDLPFRYKEVEVQCIPTQRVRKTPPGSISVAKGADEMLFYDNNDIEVLEGPGLQDDGWICQWCNELCDGESKIKAHQNMFHSHLPLNFKRADGSEPPKGYCCCECPYTTTFIHLMRNHMAKHINLFKCKYCDKTFSVASHVATHTGEEHPGLEVKINSIPNFDFLMEKLMGRVKWITWEEYIDKKFDQVASPTRHGVAKKSTAKSSILASPMCGKVKAVARKSITSLLPNHYYNPISKPSASVSELEHKSMDNKEFSYYGVPQPPVNLAQLNTYMVVGGHRMKVKCITLAQLININPKVMVQDLKYNTKYASFLSKLN